MSYFRRAGALIFLVALTMLSCRISLNNGGGNGGGNGGSNGNGTAVNEIDDTPRVEANSGRAFFRSQSSPDAYPEFEAYRVLPGTTVLAWNFDRDASEVLSVELVILQARLIDHGLLDSGLPNMTITDDALDWRISIPLELEWAADENLPRQDAFQATVDPALEGVPPGPAYLRVTYRKGAETVEQLLGFYTPGPNLYPPPEDALYFIPHYVVYRATVEIPIGYDSSSREMDLTLFQYQEVFYDYYVSQYWVISDVDLYGPGFPGTFSLETPGQGLSFYQEYRVEINATSSGVLTMEYHIVGPKGLMPPWWPPTFTNFGELGPYIGDIRYGNPRP